MHLSKSSRHIDIKTPSVPSRGSGHGDRATRRVIGHWGNNIPGVRSSSGNSRALGGRGSWVIEHVPSTWTSVRLSPHPKKGERDE